MSTTTIRTDDDLRARVAEAARIEGVSAHAFMVDAIARRARALAEREAFIELAQQRWEQFQSDGRSLSLEQMRASVCGMAVHEPAPREAPKPAGDRRQSAQGSSSGRTSGGKRR